VRAQAQVFSNQVTHRGNVIRLTQGARNEVARERTATPDAMDTDTTGTRMSKSDRASRASPTPCGPSGSLSRPAQVLGRLRRRAAAKVALNCMVIWS
jgi:hypothetical protein